MDVANILDAMSGFMELSEKKSHEPFVWIRETADCTARVRGSPYPATNCASGKSASEYSFSHLMHLAASLPFSVNSPPQFGHGCRMGRFQLVKSHDSGSPFL